MRRLLVLAAFGVLLTGCGSATTVLDTNEATALFRQDTAKHYHGRVAQNDIEGGGEPIVPTDDGRECHQGRPNHWSCSAYVYMNDPNGPNYDITGSIVIEGESIHYRAHATPDGA